MEGLKESTFSYRVKTRCDSGSCPAIEGLYENGELMAYVLMDDATPEASRLHIQPAEIKEFFTVATALIAQLDPLLNAEHPLHVSDLAAAEIKFKKTENGAQIASQQFIAQREGDTLFFSRIGKVEDPQFSLIGNNGVEFPIKDGPEILKQSKTIGGERGRIEFPLEELPDLLEELGTTQRDLATGRIAEQVPALV